MNYISHIINSSELENIFNLPSEFKNRKVEVLVIPLNEERTEPNQEKSLYGILGKYKNNLLIKNEKNAWTIAVEEKYGNSWC